MTSSARKADPVRIVEAAYDLSGDHGRWCKAVARAWAEVYGDELGAHVWTYDFDPDGGLVVGTAAAHGPTEPLLELCIEVGRSNARWFLPGNPRVMTVSDSAGGVPAKKVAHWPAALARQGVQDLVAVRADNPGMSILVALPRRSTTPLGQCECQTWARLAGHLAAGLRIRLAIGATMRANEAMSTVDPARAPRPPAHDERRADCLLSLRRGVVDIDRAGAPGRSDDVRGAIDIWRGLASGRYSLLDSFDADGRRYVVAKANESVLADPRRLTRRERQIAYYAARGYSNKLIAYTLGVSTSTAGSHLSKAMRKLGVRRKSDLASLVLALACDDDAAH